MDLRDVAEPHHDLCAARSASRSANTPFVGRLAAHQWLYRPSARCRAATASVGSRRSSSSPIWFSPMFVAASAASRNRDCPILGSLRSPVWGQGIPPSIFEIPIFGNDPRQMDSCDDAPILPRRSAPPSRRRVDAAAVREFNGGNRRMTGSNRQEMSCIFCRIVSGDVKAGAGCTRARRHGLPGRLYCSPTGTFWSFRRPRRASRTSARKPPPPSSAP